MRARVALLLLIPSALFAQQSAELAGPVKLEIRSTDSTRVLDVRVELRGALFESIGVLRPAAGTVEMSGPRGTATTPAMIELSAGTGRGSLSVPESGPELEVTVISAGAPGRRVIARGHSVTFDREGIRSLRVLASRMTTQF